MKGAEGACGAGLVVRSDPALLGAEAGQSDLFCSGGGAFLEPKQHISQV